MRKIIYPSGAIEYVDTEEEANSKEKYKTKKEPADLTIQDLQELIYELAKRANLI